MNPHNTAVQRRPERFAESDPLLLDFCMHPIVGLNAAGQVDRWNSAAERLSGYRATEIVGMYFVSLLAESARMGYQDCLEQLRNGGSVSCESTLVRKHGKAIRVRLELAATSAPEGAASGICMNIVDLEAQQARELASMEARRRSELFLATLAHELRNLVAPLRTGLYLARAHGSSASMPRTLDMMDRQLARLVRLIADLMDVGGISSGKLHLELRPVTLQQVVAASAEACGSEVAARSQTLTVEAPAQDLLVNADSDRLVQVMSNLIGNGCKYGEAGGEIRVRIAADAGFGVIEVIDDGIGIPAGELQNVFDMFAQVYEHRARANGGLGIGLSLVRSLVELHEGTVSVHSGGPGRGSTFTIRLPLAAAA